ncbi:hypothetical protein, partial [Pseudomonas helleri]|uniref:hypothetical protein n=1 Tax=Pseudomonas helleri TaxID=1608996 RepID=UPI001E3AC115
LHFLRSSTPFPAGQIFSTPLNAKSHITQQSVKGMEVKLAATFGPKQIMEAFHSKEIILNIRDRVRVEKKYTALKSAEQFESNESAFPGYRSRVFTPSVR